MVRHFGWFSAGGRTRHAFPHWSLRSEMLSNPRFVGAGNCDSKSRMMTAGHGAKESIGSLIGTLKDLEHAVDQFLFPVPGVHPCNGFQHATILVKP
jgi:hypothetical protein